MRRGYPEELSRAYDYYCDPAHPARGLAMTAAVLVLGVAFVWQFVVPWLTAWMVGLLFAGLAAGTMMIVDLRSEYVQRESVRR